LDKKIKNKRLELGLTVPEAAEKIGIATSTLWGFENGSRLPSRETLVKMANAYNCSIEYFFDRNYS
jgi:transcriptional regulator with XRE-family HTH domain